VRAAKDAIDAAAASDPRFADLLGRVCARSTQPPRVSVDGSACDKLDGLLCGSCRDSKHLRRATRDNAAVPRRVTEPEFTGGSTRAVPRVDGSAPGDVVARFSMLSMPAPARSARLRSAARGASQDGRGFVDLGSIPLS
jgi:hypothetical protein